MTKTDLTALRDKLVERLHAGAAYVEQRKAKGLPFEKAEGQWCGLLRQYEAAEDALAALAESATA